MTWIEGIHCERSVRGAHECPILTWIEGIHCERSVRGAHECPISVFTGAVGDDLSTRDRRSAGVLNQAMHPSLHLTGSANGEPKDQGNHRDRSRANEGERDQCRFSHIVATCRSGSGWFVGYSEKKFLRAFRRAHHFWPANAALFRLVGSYLASMLAGRIDRKSTRLNSSHLG